MTTTATFRVSSDDLDPSFIAKIQSLFAHREVEIIVREPELDETAYLLHNPLTRERLLESVENIHQGKNVVELDRDAYE